MNRYELFEACFPGREIRLPTKMIEERAEDGSVIGYVGVRVRRVPVGLSTVQVAAIENLCVDPDHRRQGYATRLLETAHLLAMEWPTVPWAAVFDRDGLPGLFEPLGYHRVVGGPDGFVVAELTGETWPTGAVRLEVEW